MRYGLLSIVLIGMVIATAEAAVITVNGNHEPNDTSAYDFSSGGNNPTPVLPAPMSGDLGESATVSSVEGTVHGASGSISLLTNGSGETSGTAANQSYFYNNGENAGKVLMSWSTAQDIAAVRTYSWHNYTNDRRMPHVYELYGSTAANPGTTDTDLASAEWDLIASIDTRNNTYNGQLFEFSGDAAGNVAPEHPEQTVSEIAGNSGGALGTYQHLLWRLEPSTQDRTGPAHPEDAFGYSTQDEHTFYREFDVVQHIPEPVSLSLLAAGSGVLMLRRRRQA